MISEVRALLRAPSVPYEKNQASFFSKRSTDPTKTRRLQIKLNQTKLNKKLVDRQRGKTEYPQKNIVEQGQGEKQKTDSKTELVFQAGFYSFNHTLPVNLCHTS